MHNPFILPNDHYKRDLSVVSGYQQDAAKYLQLQTGQPIEECLAYVKEQTQPGAAQGMRDPRALILTKDKHGDRQKEGASFMTFLARVSKNDFTLSPSMAAYLPDTQKQSSPVYRGRRP